MKLKQLSLFLENQPGALTAPCRLLAAAGINILTFSLADTQQFGIFRLIVHDYANAKLVLEQNGFLVKETEVIAIEVEDRPGGLVPVLEALERAGINVEYVYACTLRQDNKGVLVFRFNQTDAALAALQENKVNVLSAEELARRWGC